MFSRSLFEQYYIAVVYRSRVKTTDALFHRLLSQCGAVGIYGEKYSPGCLLNRDRIMVMRSERVIAVYDGRSKGGTLFTMRYAYTQGREVRVIQL